MLIVEKVFVLLIVFQIKHFLADYPFQTQYMLGKFRREDWIGPLAAHAGLHALLTLAIAFVAGGDQLLILAGVDFWSHFTMDRIKASPNLLGRFKPLTPSGYQIALKDGDECKLQSNRFFWWSLGVDQMVHHLTHYGIIFALVTPPWS